MPMKSFQELKSAVERGSIHLPMKEPPPRPRPGMPALIASKEICRALTEGRELLVIDDNHASWNTGDGYIALNVHGKVIVMPPFDLVAEAAECETFLARRKGRVSPFDCCMRATVRHAKHHIRLL